jgi:hypothetical protein
MVVGAGPYCARTPAVSGPSEKPAVIATAARRPAACPARGPDSSVIQALPTLNTAPLTAPCRQRPTNSNGSEWAAATSSSEVSPASPENTTTSRRRPSRSEAGPARNSAGTSPAAYDPNTAVSTSGDRCRASR